MSKQKKNLPPVAGAAARTWRRNLAASAQRVEPKTTRTLKFPLDATVTPTDWAKARTLHHVVNTDAPGSLIRMLYTLLLGGFRVFSKQAETEAFRNAAVLGDAEWRESVLSGSELTLASASFVPSGIYQRVLIAPRAVGGKDSGFRADVVAIEYAKFFCKGKHSDNIPAPEKALFDAIGTALVKSFESWADVVRQPVEAAAVIDGVLSSLNYPAAKQKLAQRIGSLRPCEPAGTVAFDGAAPQLSDAAGIEANLIVARAFRAGRAEGATTKGDLTKFAQTFFTGDPNHGGLAWLYGKGLSYFRVTDLEQILQDFDIPEAGKGAAAAVVEVAIAIPGAETTLLGGKSYAGYRPGIGGVLTSWVANYANRLFELEALLGESVEPLVLPPGLLADTQIFAEAGVTPDEVSAMLTAITEERPMVADAISRLLGHTAGASRQDIEEIENYNLMLDTLAGLLASVAEKIKKANATAEARQDKAALLTLESYAFDTPKWIRRMDKINRLNLSPIDPQADLDAGANEFNLLFAAMHAHYQQIEDWAKRAGETLSPLARLRAREEGAARKGSKRNPEEWAFRAALDMLFRSARRTSEATRRRVAEFVAGQGVFADPVDLNRYFFNNKGRLYKSPFDTNPRQPYAITRESLSRADTVLAGYKDFLSEFRKDVEAESVPSLARTMDLFQLERAWFAMSLTGFPESIPSSLALPEGLGSAFNLPLPLMLRLQGDQVTSSVMRRIFNNYYSRLQSLAALLLRDRFFLRAKFARAGENALYYAVPAGRDKWNAPERLYETPAPVGQVLRLLRDAAQSTDGVDPVLALPFLLDNKEQVSSNALRAYLRQAPHDWFFPWPSREAVDALPVGKAGLGSRLQRIEGGRLIGAPGFKGVLDKALVSPDTLSIGDISVLVSQTFRQSVSRAPDGRITVRAEPESGLVEVALPITEVKEPEQPAAFERYVAIDLGERGLGYAVFDAQSHALIEKGRVRVASMHALVRDDLAGKRRTSTVNRFRSAFDPAEERRRENVVGDFCNAINRLMWFYKAFPVLEYAAGGASSAVDKVYKGVAERYLFTGTPTVDAQRENYWAGASYWKHPSLLQYKFDRAAGKKSQVTEKLSLFPGAGASAYGTSQECSCCKRNPVEMVREASAGKSGAVFTVEQGGRVQVGGGVIQLHLSAAPEERAEYRRRNMRTPLSVPAPAGAMKADDLLRLLRRNLRQAPAQKSVKDTSVSVYQCVFVDCGKTIHAEENAAVNIGTKFAAARPKGLDGGA